MNTLKSNRGYSRIEMALTSHEGYIFIWRVFSRLLEILAGDHASWADICIDTVQATQQKGEHHRRHRMLNPLKVAADNSDPASKFKCDLFIILIVEIFFFLRS